LESIPKVRRPVQQLPALRVRDAPAHLHVLFPIERPLARVVLLLLVSHLPALPTPPRRIPVQTQLGAPRRPPGCPRRLVLLDQAAAARLLDVGLDARRVGAAARSAAAA